jgi:hypothetical protein
VRKALDPILICCRTHRTKWPIGDECDTWHQKEERDLDTLALEWNWIESCREVECAWLDIPVRTRLRLRLRERPDDSLTAAGLIFASAPAWELDIVSGEFLLARARP